MKDILSKIVAIFLLMVFVAYMVNHGKVDFSGVDWVANKTKTAVESEEGQELISEVKDTATGLAKELISGTKETIEQYKDVSTLKEVKLIRVIDGDTIEVESEDETLTVRLIGIDTPESVNPDESKNTENGVLASEHTKEILNNYSTVYLEFDESDKDIYDRTLAYVWLADNVDATKNTIQSKMLNGIILKDGYAVAKEYEPNTKYSTIFESIYSEAVENKKGLWNGESNSD